MTRKRGPGRGLPPLPRPNQNSNADAYSLSPVASLALEKAKRLIKGLPAREKDIHAKVLRQLEDIGLRAPDHIQVLVHKGSTASVQDDAKNLVRQLGGSVLICDPDGKILTYAWPT